jgi:hypothetical protein
VIGDNPFSPPDGEGDARLTERPYYAEGDRLVITTDGPPLPPRCVKCNAPATERHRQTLQWFPRWVIATILVCLPVYLVTFLLTRRTARIDVGLCSEHASRRRTFARLGGTVLIGGLAVLLAGTYAEHPVTLCAGLVGVLGGAVALQPSVVLRPTRIEEHLAFYRGADPAFLRSLDGPR